MRERTVVRAPSAQENTVRADGSLPRWMEVPNDNMSRSGEGDKVRRSEEYRGRLPTTVKSSSDIRLIRNFIRDRILLRSVLVHGAIIRC
jgi:hypothetical protein